MRTCQPILSAIAWWTQLTQALKYQRTRRMPQEKQYARTSRMLRLRSMPASSRSIGLTRKLEEAEVKAAQASFAAAQQSRRTGSAKGQIQLKKLLLLQEALDSVDADIDLTPFLVHRAQRKLNRPMMIPSSVVRPKSLPMPEELKIEYKFGIDYDCDQVRAMIKIFVSRGDWTLEEFRQALGNVSRQQLTTFLTRRGSAGPQLPSAAYQLSWEFFNWREYLGLPLEGASIHDDVHTVECLQRERQRQELQRAQKRARAVADGDSGEGKAKRQKKKAGRQPLGEIVNGAE